MRKIGALLIIIGLILVGNINPAIIQAQGGAPCMDHQAENSDAVRGCKPWLFFDLDKLRIRTRLDSAWLRSEPSSNAAVVAKVPRKPYNNLQIAYDTAPDHTFVSWDGTQWWWYVKVIRGR